MTLVLALLLAATATAAPRFDTSTITASRFSIHPLETIEYTLTVRNTGDSTPSYLRIANPISPSAMYVSSSPDWKFIESERELSWMGTIPPGASKTLHVTLVAGLESAGTTLSNRPAIHYDGNYWAVEHALEVDSPPPSGGIVVGRFRVLTAGVYVFGYLAIAAVILIGTVAIRRRALAGMTLIVVSVGFLLIFAAVAKSDARMRSEFRESRCEVLDSFARYTESRSKSSKRNGTWNPQFALRYTTPAGETVSVGAVPASALQKNELPSMGRGAQAPCWYDPADPKKVVLDRNPGGAYLFAAIPLLTLALGIFLARR